MAFDPFALADREPAMSVREPLVEGYSLVLNKVRQKDTKPK